MSEEGKKALKDFVSKVKEMVVKVENLVDVRPMKGAGVAFDNGSDTDEDE